MVHHFLIVKFVAEALATWKTFLFCIRILKKLDSAN